MLDGRLTDMRRRGARARERSLALAAEERRRLASTPCIGRAARGGRLWLNGRELGEPSRHLRHLGASYD